MQRHYCNEEQTWLDFEGVCSWCGVTEEQARVVEMHPSGITMERWRFPFKTPEEMAMIRRWLAVNNLDSGAIPF